jgi:hypothetical protein
LTIKHGGNRYLSAREGIKEHRFSLTSGTSSTVPGATPSPPIDGTDGIVQVTISNVFASSPDLYRVHQF